MAGTQSVQSDELRILGIPRSRQTVANIDSNHGASWKGSHCLSTQATRHTKVKLVRRAVSTIVVRVQPRTSRGITDLLSPLAYTCLNACGSSEK